MYYDKVEELNRAESALSEARGVIYKYKDHNEMVHNFGLVDKKMPDWGSQWLKKWGTDGK